jgi:hypothetical protein
VIVTLRMCECGHPYAIHREPEPGGECDEVVLCDRTGCLCPGFQEAR